MLHPVHTQKGLKMVCGIKLLILYSMMERSVDDHTLRSFRLVARQEYRLFFNEYCAMPAWKCSLKLNSRLFNSTQKYPLLLSGLKNVHCLLIGLKNIHCFLIELKNSHRFLIELKNSHRFLIRLKNIHCFLSGLKNIHCFLIGLKNIHCVLIGLKNIHCF